MTSVDILDPGQLMVVASPEVSLVDAAALAARFREGIVSVRALVGERDKNFHVVDKHGDAFVLKVLHFAEDVQVVDLQTSALIHACRIDPALPIPRVIPPMNGEADALVWRTGAYPDRQVRMLSYLPGKPLYLAAPHARQRMDIGRWLARLDLALRDFTHPAQDHELLWNLERVLRVRPLLDTVEDPTLRRLSESFVQHFEDQVVPALAGLRRQPIHNDLNPHNALVADDDACRLTGIIDFGDMLAGPLVQEVSTAAAYQIQPAGCPMAGPADLVHGYHRELPLSDAELALIPDLITARLVLTIAITSWRAAQHPDNAPYILRNRRKSDMGLLRLHENSRDENIERLLQALNEAQNSLPTGPHS